MLKGTASIKMREIDYVLYCDHVCHTGNRIIGEAEVEEWH